MSDNCLTKQYPLLKVSYCMVYSIRSTCFSDIPFFQGITILTREYVKKKK